MELGVVFVIIACVGWRSGQLSNFSRNLRLVHHLSGAFPVAVSPSEPIRF